MNGLTHSRALVKSIELNPHHFSALSSVRLLFRQHSGRARTFTLKHTLRKFSIPANLHRRSTANLRHRSLTAMDPDSDSHLQTPEFEATIAKTSDDGASFSSLDEHSVIADDEETRDANQNEVKGFNSFNYFEFDIQNLVKNEI